MKKRVLSILSAAILAVTASIPVNVSALKQEEIATGRLSEYVKRFGDNAVVVFYSESENNGNAELIITEDYEAYNLTERKREAVVTFEKDSLIPVDEINEKIAPYKLTQMEEANKYLIPTLPDIYEVLKTYEVEKYISFDLGLLSKYHYYTGIIFKAYTYGIGDAIVKGGRYDNLLSKFGKMSPAIGFVVLLDGLMNALSRQKINIPVSENIITITYNENTYTDKLNEAMKLRKDGQKVKLVKE